MFGLCDATRQHAVVVVTRKLALLLNSFRKQTVDGLPEFNEDPHVHGLKWVRNKGIISREHIASSIKVN